MFTRADKAVMAQPTRFDLSRLEGCTGTVSDERVAVPHALRPSRDSDAPPARPAGPVPTAPKRNQPAPQEAPTTRAPAQPAPAVQAGAPASAPAAAPSEAPPPSPRPASTRREAAPRPAPRSPAITAESAVAVAIDPEVSDRVSFGVVLALTLSAWIPVLLLWWARIA